MMRPFQTLLLSILTLPSVSYAQAPLTLPRAITQALKDGPDVTSARTTLLKAQGVLRSTKADPTSVITTLSAAEQGVVIATARLDETRLNVAQKLTHAYLLAVEGAQRVDLNTAQVALDERKLQIAKARLAARVITSSDLGKVQTSLRLNQQELADAKARLPVLKSQVARLLGLSSGTSLNLTAPAAAPVLKENLQKLQTGLDQRVPRLVILKQDVSAAQLQVKLASNDYTPARTLQDAQLLLSNAQRALDDGRRAAATEVSDAYRAVQDAQERTAIAQQQLRDARTDLSEAKVRVQVGTAAPIEAQEAEVNAQKAQFGVLQAQHEYWRALMGLTVASGQDMTGLIK